MRNDWLDRPTNVVSIIPGHLLPVCAAFTLWVQLFSGCGVTVQLGFWLDGEVQCVGLPR